jgi:hypothetical protein
LSDDASVDLDLPGQLLVRQDTLAYCLFEEGVFLLAVEISHAHRMFDQIAVRIRRGIFRDPLQPVEQVAGVDLDEAVDVTP